MVLSTKPSTSATPSISAVCAGQTVRVSLSQAAAQQLALRKTPLVAEAEVLFSCLIRKQLGFREADPASLSWPVTDALHVAVRPVRFELCGPEPGAASPPVVDFPATDPGNLLPRSFSIDHRGGEWTGTFTFD